MEQVTICLPSRVLRLLKKASDREHETVHELIKVAIETWVDKYEDRLWKE